MLVSVEQLKKEINQPLEKMGLVDANALPKKAINSNVSKGTILNRDENLEKRKEMISGKGFEPADFAFERAVGKNDSLYSNFTELIALTKRKVGRIVIKENGKRVGFATGFMVSKNLMLTNWHVFNNASAALESEIHFFYEYDAQGHPITPTVFKFDSTQFFNDQNLDYCLVAVQPFDVTGKMSLANIGYLFLDKSLGKIGEIGVEKLNIIHHPQGDFKQISIRENLFVDIDDTKIFYETDTAQGSSGSPVFNDQWQVVGLHHKSVAKMSEDGKFFLDKDDNVIPVINDKIDVARVVWLKNEGIRISVILKHLEKSFPNNAVLKTLETPPLSENLHFSINDEATTNFDNNNSNNMNSDKNITINVPIAALNSENTIEISLSSKKLNNAPVASSLPPVENSSNKMDELLQEIAKVDKENAIDFSKCTGYNRKFLGVEIRLPKPKKVIENQLARLKDNTTELKYFNYSVIFNALTKMPLISAINVEGDAEQRLDNSKRSDDWLRDARIDIEAQLTDKFYAKSNFDKGHMSRFEDADWGETELIALRNGVFTCFYTNACPQVPTFNRSGFWGKLEKTVLEKGIKKEVGKLARMTVFNGPIFDDSKDKIFKGIKIPMQYFKVILWLNDAQKLRATAFMLSQEALVGDVVFDESMRISEEALDIDKVVTFKSFQCSLKNLSVLTKIDFKFLEKFDTFETVGGIETMLIEDVEALML
jgi:endonuclease G, mitochondrial